MDAAPLTGKTTEQLATLCGTGCKGFTTAGWRKKILYPGEAWQEWGGAGACDGMYVKLSVQADGK